MTRVGGAEIPRQKQFFFLKKNKTKKMDETLK